MNSCSMKSTSQLDNEALDYRFLPDTSLKVYLKVCVSMLEQAQSAYQTGNLQRAYIFYFRYVDLCTNKLSKHPQYLCSSSSAQVALNRQEYMQLIKLEVPAVLKIIEDLRKQIGLIYSKQQLSLAKNIAQPKMQQHQQNHKNKPKFEAYKKKPALNRLPPTFDEHLFNDSISYFRNTTALATPINRSAEKSIPQESAPADAPTEPDRIHYYPELPQLTFTTF